MNIKRFIPHAIALTVFFLVCFIYFLPQFQGQVIDQGDIASWKGAAQETMAFEEKTGEKSLWTNSMFGGMPTYQITNWQPHNYTTLLGSALNLFLNSPAGIFFCVMLSMYILLISLGVNSWIAIIGALSFGLTTNLFTMYEAGHVTKAQAISYWGFVVAGIVTAYRKNLLIGGVLFAIGMALNIGANHFQMTYYLFIVMLIYAIFQLVDDIQNKKIMSFLKASLVLIVGGALAIGSSASKIWTTYEYSKSTMRGGQILESTEADAKKSTETDKNGGLEWEYAMQWSQGTADILASFIPGAAGGGSQEPLPKNSAIKSELAQKGANLPDDFKAPLYWGSLPFTSGPAYFGAGIFFLFILGALIVRGPIKWWLLVATILTLILSMGKNFESFNHIVFNYFPYYNKFRAVNSITTMTAFTMVILAILGLNQVIKDKDEASLLKALKISAGVSLGICLFIALMGSSFFTFGNSGDAQYEQMGLNLSALASDRKSLFSSDAWRSFFIILLFAASIWAYMTNKIKLLPLTIALGVVTIFDLASVAKRYLDNSSFVDESVVNQRFTPRPVDEQILRDTSLDYRVFDITINTFNSSQASYFHKTVGGYSAVKMQRFQDIIDKHISNNNMRVLNMLNTKYFIVKGPDGNPVVQQNPSAMGNAWFVKNIIKANTNNEEINALNTFDPSVDAAIHKDFDGYIKGIQPTKEGAISLTSYEPNKLVYASDSPSEQLAVFSEVWYGPNLGWQAYIDDKPVEHIRANYILRAMRVPAGKHTIRFEFSPQSYNIGETISLVCSLIILALTALLIYLWVKNANTENEIKASM
ncbi:MAG: YfhO family protein [Saprospiraceae bacterium]|nr:YfhO family protein [Saprospiraceae bacterium]